MGNFKNTSLHTFANICLHVYSKSDFQFQYTETLSLFWDFYFSYEPSFHEMIVVIGHTDNKLL